MKRTTAYYFGTVLLSICVAMSLCMDYATIPDASGYSCVFGEVLLNLYLSMSGNMLLSTLIAVFAAYFLINTQALINNKSRTIYIFSIVLALLWILYWSYSTVNSIELLYSSAGQLVKTVILLIGYTVIIHRFSCLFDRICTDGEEDNKLQFLEKYGYLKIVLIILVLWLPGVVMSYPGNTMFDTWTQLDMAFGSLARTTHHPATATMMLYMFINFGKNVFGSANIGLFICEILQVLYAVLVLAYTIKVMMDEFNAPKWLVIFTFIIMALSPYFSKNITIIQKDIPYSISYVLLSVELMLFIQNPDRLKMKKHLVFSAISVMGVYLFRNNGLYALLLILVFFGIYLIEKHMFKYMTVFAVTMIVSALITTSVGNANGFSAGSKAEMLCLPMQQVGRIVEFFPDDVSDEQRATLENVCDYEVMSGAYNQLTADPVKNSFYRSATTEDYIGFLKVWIQLAVKHPVTALSATLAQNLPLITPFTPNGDIDCGLLDYCNENNEPLALDIGLSENAKLSEANNTLFTWFNLLSETPVISVLSQQAVYVILLFVMSCYSIHYKNKKFILAAVPSYVVVLMVIVGPCIQFNPRYAYPIVYQIPALVAFYIWTKSYLRKA